VNHTLVSVKYLTQRPNPHHHHPPPQQPTAATTEIV
jgi:hypothetical protein